MTLGNIVIEINFNRRNIYCSWMILLHLRIFKRRGILFQISLLLFSKVPLILQKPWLHCCENVPLTLLPSNCSKHKLTLMEKAKGSKSNIVLGNNSALKSAQDHFKCCPFLLADWSRLSKLQAIWCKETSTDNRSTFHDSITKDYTSNSGASSGHLWGHL